MTGLRKLGLVLLSLIALLSCSPQYQVSGMTSAAPRLHGGTFTSWDGVVLPYRNWGATLDHPKAVIIALHGFNDYSNFIDEFASLLVEEKVATYAFDQRGFGASPQAGVWGGKRAMLEDVRAFVGLIKQQYPDVPLYLFGESMGGATVMLTLAETPDIGISGAILSAPAVWGPSTWPWYQRATLWVTSHLIPSLRLSGKGLNILPSDNFDMLRALGRDPLIIKETRVDSIHGLSYFMDDALKSAPNFKTPALILYGMKDQVIPWGPVAQMVATLPNDPETMKHQTIALYEHGYHMLFRDLYGQIVRQDIISWLNDQSRPLPSSADVRGRERLASHSIVKKDD